MLVTSAPWGLPGVPPVQYTHFSVLLSKALGGGSAWTVLIRPLTSRLLLQTDLRLTRNKKLLLIALAKVPSLSTWNPETT